MQTVIAHTTSPTLTAGWFTGVYLRIEGIAMLFTLLFLCAAAAEALLRQQPGLLARATFVYLPLAALGTALATPLAMLVLAATDQLASSLGAMAGQDSTHFLTGASAWVAAGLTVANPFFAVLAGGLVVAAGGALWVEMLIREIAVYLIVAMLPLAFAAMVWPARRTWVTRSLEVLVALILSKLVIVVVLALGAAALAHSDSGGLTRLLGGLALILIGAFSPWVLLRLIPLSEMGAAAVGHIRGQVHATAGLRTPEAAIASHTAQKVTGKPGAAAAAGAGEVGVAEMLEHMIRTAQTAEAPHPSTSPPAATAQSGDGVGGSGNGHNGFPDRERGPDSPASANGDRRMTSPEASHPAPAGTQGERRSGDGAVIGARDGNAGTPAQSMSEPVSSAAGEQTMVQQADGSWQPLVPGNRQRPDPAGALGAAPRQVEPRVRKRRRSQRRRSGPGDGAGA